MLQECDRRLSTLALALIFTACGGSSPSTPAPAASPSSEPAPAASASMANPAYDAEFPISGRTFHVATTGSDANAGSEAAPFASISKAASVVESGDAVLVHAGVYREKVDITRSGAPGAYVVFKAVGGVAVEDPKSAGWSWNWDGVFTLTGAAYVVLSGFEVRHSHWFGIAGSGSHHVFVQNCTTDDTGASGIYFHDSHDVSVRGNAVRRACSATRAMTGGGGTQECISMASVTDFEVHHNEVYESAISEADSVGGEGIDTKESCARGRVFRNHVHDLVRLGIYVDSWDGLLTDVEVFENVVHACGHGFAVSSENGGTVRRVRIVNNLAYRNRQQGIVISSWGEPGKADGPREDVAIVNNTTYANGDASWGGGITVESRNVRGLLIRNNIASQNAKWQLAVADPSRVTADFNLIDGFRGFAYAGEIRGDHPAEGDPRFVFPAGGDFHLNEGSLAIDAGSPEGAPAGDLDGIARPQRSGYDIGAYEKR